MVGSPGNATNALTVGGYDFRSSWENLDGKWSSFNLDLGNVSAYSSPGFRLDGVIKPEIIAPATYTISPLSRDAEVLGRLEGGARIGPTSPRGDSIWRGRARAPRRLTWPG
jgi:hypothetical protein